MRPTLALAGAWPSVRPRRWLARGRGSVHAASLCTVRGGLRPPSTTTGEAKSFSSVWTPFPLVPLQPGPAAVC